MRDLGTLGAAFLLLRAAAAQTCAHPDDPQFYFNHKYSVHSVAVSGPLSFVPALRSREKQAEAQMPIQPGRPFTPADYSAGVTFLRTFFTLPSSNSPLAVRVVRAGLRGCNDAALTLDVTYYVILSDPIGYLDHPAESLKADAERPAASQAERSGMGKLGPRMILGYDPQWKLAGGAALALRAGPSLQLSASAVESFRAHRENAVVSGAGTASGQWLRSWNYRLEYHRDDLPTGSGRIQTARLSLGAGGVSGEAGPLHLSARYGLSFEGGHDQSSAAPASLPSGTVAAAPHGALKAAAGLSLYGARYAAALSYGIEAATAGASTSLDYARHLANAMFVGRLPTPDARNGLHRFVTLELQASGGVLQQMGATPVAERFFGGGQAPQWSTSGTWSLPAGPLFRGIPGYGLHGPVSQGTALGGDRFWSFNSTLARPLFGRPLAPEDLGRDPQLQQQIAFGLNSSQQALANSYAQKLPAMQRLISNLSTLKPELQALDRALAAAAPRAPDSAQAAIQSARSRARSAERAIRAGQPLAVLKISVPNALAALDAVLPLLGGPDKDNLATLRAALANSQSGLLQELDSIDRGPAERRAQRDLSSARSAIDTLLHEVNLVSLAPVAIFDAARLWPDPAGTRLAPGAGLRFSLVTLNLTAGYAVNLRRAPSDSRGAFFFSLDVSDLFR